MKNLTLLSQIRLARFGKPAGKDIHHSVDPETGNVYVAYSTGPSEGVLVRISDLQVQTDLGLAAIECPTLSSSSLPPSHSEESVIPSY